MAKGAGAAKAQGGRGARTESRSTRASALSAARRCVTSPCKGGATRTPQKRQEREDKGSAATPNTARKRLTKNPESSPQAVEAPGDDALDEWTDSDRILGEELEEEGEEEEEVENDPPLDDPVLLG